MKQKTPKHAVLDDRHAREQDAIGQPRFPAGRYYAKVKRCYAVDGDPEIWVPESDVTYFVAELWALPILPLRDEGMSSMNKIISGSWVNRLRFNGMAQLKEFVLVATDTPYGHHERITEDDLEEIVSSTNPLEGKYVQLHVAPPVQSGYMHHAWKRLSFNELVVWRELIDRAVERTGG